ncbi:MAG: hypothetical protein LBG27_07985 [Spirochaetaceae bacterium]|jgi:hypothetical protein|nr:hypothetical protein [Spirochaetaceae bacterium]
MTIAVLIKRVFLLVALSQALWLTTCEEAPGRLVKIATLSNIPVDLEINATAKAQLSEYDNLAKLFFQEAGKWYLKTNGLYVMVLFLPVAVALEWEQRILNGENPKEMLDYAQAVALMNISGETVQGRINTLSTKIGETGFYWEGDGTTVYGICTMLTSPDARFILQIDFSTKKYTNALPDYALEYVPSSDLRTVFNVVRSKSSTTSIKSTAWKWLGENFIMELVDRFS